MKKRILVITATVAFLGLTGTLTPAFTVSNELTVVYNFSFQNHPHTVQDETGSITFGVY